MSSPPVPLQRACADGIGRVRGLRARSVAAGFLGLAASIFFCAAPVQTLAQFPIRQFENWRANEPGAPRLGTPLPANTLPPYREADASRSPNGNARPHPAVARIIVQERDAISYGSGTLIDSRGQFGLVVTNWHVVRDAAGQITVEFPGGWRSPAQVVKTDKDWDLAALSIARPPVEPLSISPQAPQPGQWLTIAGYGSGEYRAASGRCTQYVAPGEDFPYEMLELSAEARQGDSGGPILNERGELCGVLFGSGRGYTSGSYGGRVLQFLASVVPGGQPGSDAAIHPPGAVALKPPADSTATPASDPDAAIRTWTALHDPQPVTNPAASVPPHLAHTHDAGPLTPAETPLPADRILDVPEPAAPPADEIDPRAAVDRIAVNVSGPISPLAAEMDRVDGLSRSHSSLPPRSPEAADEGIDLEHASPEQLLAAAWKRIGGATLVDQGKTILAVIGVLAVLIQFWRISRAKEPEVIQDE